MTIARISFVVLLGSLALRGAELTEVTVNPWHADNAVLAVGRVPFGTSSRSEWLTGSLQRSAGRRRDLSLAVSTAPTQWKRLSTSRPTDTGESAWSYDSAPDSIQPGVVFDVAIGEKTSQGTYTVLRTATNLVAGPVWALLVTPSADDHHLPGIPPEVLQRIRILPVDGTSGGWTSTGWLSGKAMEKHHSFCGLPRALAILLARTPTPAGSPPLIFGLVLVPTTTGIYTPEEEFVLAGWKPDNRASYHPFLSTLVTNAVQAQYVVPFGAEARYNTLANEYRNEMLDAKREGIVKPKFATPSLSWSRFSSGDMPAFPFRIHGFIR